MNTIPLSALDLGFVALLLLGHAALDLSLRLGLGKTVLLSALRAAVQLLLLGQVLGWIFDQRNPWAVVGLSLVMATIAGVETARRATRRVPGQRRLGIVIMLVSSLSITLYGVGAVLGPEPWWEPRYVIPVLGMILGNSLTGVSLGIETSLEGYDRERGWVEWRLALGASVAEAARPIQRRALRAGLLPILNAMAAAGLISIPGMMTGQILGGEEPEAAARYQIFILFLIAGAVALGTLGAVLGCTRLLFDARGRLRTDRIRNGSAD